MRVDWFHDRQCGWHIHIYLPHLCVSRHGVQFSVIGAWWTKRCDWGFNLGRKAWHFAIAA